MPRSRAARPAGTPPPPSAGRSPRLPAFRPSVRSPLGARASIAARPACCGRFAASARRAPDLQERWPNLLGNDPRPTTPAEFSAIIAEDFKVWRRVITEGKITID